MKSLPEVLKTKPSYEMDFAARLNMALSNSSKETAVKNLERMLKDEKNKDFQDQIYFAMASISLEKGDKKEGIKNLELSLAKSTANISQKAESYLMLADLYFEEPAAEAQPEPRITAPAHPTQSSHQIGVAVIEIQPDDMHRLVIAPGHGNFSAGNKTQPQPSGCLNSLSQSADLVVVGQRQQIDVIGPRTFNQGGRRHQAVGNGRMAMQVRVLRVHVPLTA